ncbi:Structure-specific endonuclease subunit SLX1 [Chionoecetes opilio]|uniref:Structure-specific endonuclease subunit SLX1 n=1 Tax=Chionoecetes opilio TaxID=41210 RepID=A0A8J5CU90_CHIOP|nr:Structure-specific endonuclease subunit SLX1 [Chionoecetes opilio]
MLQTRPWCRLPLTLRWIDQKYIKDFPPGLEPPVHIPIAYGPVKSVKVKKPVYHEHEDKDIEDICTLCRKVVRNSDKMRCLSSSCTLVAHIKCLAHEMLKDDTRGMLVPLEGNCPSCGIMCFGRPC